MNRPAIVELLVFAVLLTSGTLLRLLLRDLPNFAPVAAVALFAGFYFRSRLTAALLPFAIMLLSDYWIGAYSRPMMALVYGTLILPVACRSLLIRAFQLLNSPSPPLVGEFRPATRQRNYSAAMTLAVLLGSSLVMSTLFFLVTNFGSWLWFDMYDRSLSGLVECYVAALPFFRYTLAGDMFFATVLFGGYTWAWTAGLLAAPSAPAAGRS